MFSQFHMASSIRTALSFYPSELTPMICIYQSTTLMNYEFPVLKPGPNAISWTGTVTKVVVRPNWRYL